MIPSIIPYPPPPMILYPPQYEPPNDSWITSAANLCKTWRAGPNNSPPNDVLTKGWLFKFIEDMGLDQAEYFMRHIEDRERDRAKGAAWQDEPLYDKNTFWIAVYWVIGGSEGYYVHVEQIDRENDKRCLLFTGKFWTRPQAAWVTLLIQTMINHW